MHCCPRPSLPFPAPLAASFASESHGSLSLLQCCSWPLAVAAATIGKKSSRVLGRLAGTWTRLSRSYTALLCT
ncbi:hypothetical protein OH77DRAFT_1429772 [Trametes cingulata]|nr:hypothetical protein OH77DRAFT_1429772 [Trametes cingulata]